MAGLAAVLHAPNDPQLGHVRDTLGAALAARGFQTASTTRGRTTLIVRAALPIVHEVDGVASVVVDGVAELSALLAAYRRRGLPGLLGGAQPYALILADRDAIVLARNGDGPPLYYARAGGRTLVASEPEALLAAGVAADPDPATVARFLASGECDASHATFYADIRRVLPGQVLALRRNATPAEVYDAPGRPAPIQGRTALRWATADGRIGVRLAPGVAGGAMLGAALSHVDAERRDHPDDQPPLPVYSTRFPGLDDTATEYASALLSALPPDSVRHRGTPFFADRLDLDSFLADVGEPLPDLASYLLWATARATAGEVDALLDAAAPAGHLARLADRVQSRYGVELRFPRCGVGLGAGADAEWATIVRGTLPPATARIVLAETAPAELTPPLPELLARVGDDLAAALLHTPGRRETGWRSAGGIEALAALMAGRRLDAAALYRRFVLARWLCRHVTAAASVPVPRAPLATTVAGQEYAREPIQTEPLLPGDPIAEKLTWYVAEAFAAAAYPKHPWYVLVAAKAVAVAQGLAVGVWEIRPGPVARALAPVRGEPAWLTQVLIEHGGAARTAGEAVARRLGLRGIAGRLADGGLRSVRGPRPDAAAPAHVSVVPPPRDPDGVAAELLAALAKVLPEEAMSACRGVAILSADAAGAQLHGWAGPGEWRVALALAAGNPLGQGPVPTPLALAYVVPAAAKRTPPAKRAKPAKTSRR